MRLYPCSKFSLLGALFTVCLLLTVNLHAQTTVYWDINTTDTGATSSGTGDASGTWQLGVGTLWTTDATGASGHTTWVNGDNAVFSAGTNATGISTITLGGPISVANLTTEEGALTINSNILTLVGVGGSTVDVGTGTSLLINSFVAGTVAFNKTGAGSLALRGTNTYTGATTVTDGTLIARSSAALGTTASGTTVNSGATLALENTVSNVLIGAETLTLNGSGFGNNGALRNISGASNSYGGAITLASDSKIQSDAGRITINGAINGSAASTALTFDGAGNTTVNGAIGSNISTLTKNGTGILTLNGPSINTYSGPTQVNEGSLVSTKSGAGLNSATGTGPLIIGDGIGAADSALVSLASNNQLADSTAVTVNSDGRLNIRNEIIGSLAGSGTTVMQTGSILTMGGDNTSTTYSGSFAGGGNVVKTGTGTFTLTSSSTLFRDTTVSAGEYRVDSGVLTAASVAYAVNVATGAGETATLSVLNGGDIRNATANIGSGAGATGTATITGNGSTWTSVGAFTIGSAGGTGTFNVLDNADITNVGVTIGTGAGSNGTVNVTGDDSTWTSPTGFTIGVGGGTGSLNITAGADVTIGSGTTTDGITRVGFQTGTGSINISGSGSSFTLTSSGLNGLQVGAAGSPTPTGPTTGAFNMSDGAQAFINTGFWLGNDPSSHGTLSVDGADTFLIVGNSLYVGQTNTGSATVTNGGRVTVVGGVRVGNQAGSNGSFDLSDSGSVLQTANLVVGFNGTGTMNVNAGTTVSSSLFGAENAVNLGLNAGANGTIVVNGGTLFADTHNVGLGGNGTLSVTNGGQVIAFDTDTSTAGAINVGVSDAANGIVNIGAYDLGAATTGGTLTADSLNFGASTGTKQLNFNQTDSTTLSLAITGAGDVTQRGTGTTTLSGSSANTYTGATTVNGGVLALNKTAGVDALGDTATTVNNTGTLRLLQNNQIADTANVTVNAGGTFDLNGAIETFNSLTLNGGTLNLGAGGNLSLTTLTITGNSVIDFANGGAGLLNVDTFNIAGGATLTINNWIDNTDFFFAQNWAGATKEVRGSTPMNQITFTGWSNDQTKWQDYDSQITPVPEPSTYGALFIGAAAAFTFWRRKRRKA